MEFDPDGFSVKDLRTKIEILKSNSDGDLYPFHGSNQNKSPTALLASSGGADVWHRRLGHPSNSSLSHLISNYFIPCNNKTHTSSVCDACQKGKHVRLPFGTSNSITYFPFQILHCDLWTSPVESFTGIKYCLVVRDDYSHYTWTFPLKFKSDVFSTLHDFYSLILNQFHICIQCIQYDNVKEFDKNSLRDFLASKDVFRLSCPYSSPQNDKAERAIRSLNDIM